MTKSEARCAERYYLPGDAWHTVVCGRPAKGLALVGPYRDDGGKWIPMCGVHVRRYRDTKALTA